MATQYAFGKIVTDGLVLCLDAADRNSYVSGSTTWRDLSGNNNTGTLTNGPTFNTGSGGNIVFDGANDYVNTPVNIDNITCTLCAWFRPFIITGNRGIILTDNGSWDRGFEISEGVFAIHTNSTLASTTIIPSLNTWQNACLTYASDLSMTFYVNGVNAWTGSQVGGTLGSTVEIGRANFSGGAGSRFYNGNIATVQIYNRVLSATEILQNYNATKARFGL